MTVDTTVASAIQGWLQEHVTGNQAIDNDALIIQNGILTSLSVVELVLFLEERFGITVDDDDVVEENFASINAIANLVASKQA